MLCKLLIAQNYNTYKNYNKVRIKLCRLSFPTKKMKLRDKIKNKVKSNPTGSKQQQPSVSPNIQFDESHLLINFLPLEKPTQLNEIKIEAAWEKQSPHAKRSLSLQINWFRKTLSNIQPLEDLKDRLNYQLCVQDVGLIYQIQCLPLVQGIEYVGMPFMATVGPVILDPQTEQQSQDLYEASKATFFIEYKQLSVSVLEEDEATIKEGLVRVVQNRKLELHGKKSLMTGMQLLFVEKIDHSYPELIINRQNSSELNVILNAEGDYVSIEMTNSKIRDTFLWLMKKIREKLFSTPQEPSTKKQQNSKQSNNSFRAQNERKNLSQKIEQKSSSLQQDEKVLNQCQTNNQFRKLREKNNQIGSITQMKSRGRLSKLVYLQNKQTQEKPENINQTQQQIQQSKIKHQHQKKDSPKKQSRINLSQRVEDEGQIRQQKVKFLRRNQQDEKPVSTVQQPPDQKQVDIQKEGLSQVIQQETGQINCQGELEKIEEAEINDEGTQGKQTKPDKTQKNHPQKLDQGKTSLYEHENEKTKPQPTAGSQLNEMSQLKEEFIQNQGPYSSGQSKISAHFRKNIQTTRTRGTQVQECPTPIKISIQPVQVRLNQDQNRQRVPEQSAEQTLTKKQLEVKVNLNDKSQQNQSDKVSENCAVLGVNGEKICKNQNSPFQQQPQDQCRKQPQQVGKQSNSDSERKNSVSKDRGGKQTPVQQGKYTEQIFSSKIDQNQQETKPIQTESPRRVANKIIKFDSKVYSWAQQNKKNGSPTSLISNYSQTDNKQGGETKSTTLSTEQELRYYKNEQKMLKKENQLLLSKNKALAQQLYTLKSILQRYNPRPQGQHQELKPEEQQTQKIRDINEKASQIQGKDSQSVPDTFVQLSPYQQLMKKYETLKVSNQSLVRKCHVISEEKESLEQDLMKYKVQLEELESENKYLQKKCQSLNSQLAQNSSLSFNNSSYGNSPVKGSPKHHTLLQSQDALYSSLILKSIPSSKSMNFSPFDIQLQEVQNEQEQGERCQKYFSNLPTYEMQILSLQRQLKELVDQNTSLKSILQGDKKKSGSGRTQLKLELLQLKKLVNRLTQALTDKDVTIENMKQINKAMNEKLVEEVRQKEALASQLQS